MQCNKVQLRISSEHLISPDRRKQTLRWNENELSVESWNITFFYRYYKLVRHVRTGLNFQGNYTKLNFR